MLPRWFQACATVEWMILSNDCFYFTHWVVPKNSLESEIWAGRRERRDIGELSEV